MAGPVQEPPRPDERPPELAKETGNPPPRMTALSHRRPRRRSALWLVTALVAVTLAACTDDPVSETLTLEFFPEPVNQPNPAEGNAAVLPDTAGHVRIEAQIEIRRHLIPRDNPLVVRRVNDRTEALMNEHDPWQIRFDRVFEPIADGAEWRRAERELTSYRRWALAADPDTALRDFFVDTPMRPIFEVRDNEPRLPGQRLPPPRTVTLAFVFSGGTRATAGESATVHRGSRDFADDAARYQRRAAALWEYMNDNPGRRFETLRGLFAAAEGEELPESQLIAQPRELAWSAGQAPARPGSASLPRLRDLEIDLIERVVAAADPLVRIFEIPKDDSFTLQELSRRVFDPFPGVVTAKPDGTVIEAVGFVEGGEGYSIPSLDLWNAYRALDGLFVSPDPLVFLLERRDDFGCAEDDDACTSSARVSAFLERGPLTARPGSAALIQQTLEAELQPLSEYRLVWIRGVADETATDAARPAIETGG